MSNVDDAHGTWSNGDAFSIDRRFLFREFVRLLTVILQRHTEQADDGDGGQATAVSCWRSLDFQALPCLLPSGTKYLAISYSHTLHFVTCRLQIIAADR